MIIIPRLCVKSGLISSILPKVFENLREDFLFKLKREMASQQKPGRETIRPAMTIL